MKFHIIVTEDRSKVLANVYERPYSYSEYTSGGGCYNAELVDIDEVLSGDNEETNLLIYPDLETANKALKDRNYFNRPLIVIPITDLEA